jgi:hypothetical protein
VAKVMTSFHPSLHGFHFANQFTNTVLTVTLPIVGKQTLQTEGRCGGMAYLSLDYFRRNIVIPTVRTGDFSGADQVPADGTFLADKIMERLLQSFSDNFMKWLCFFAPVLVTGYPRKALDAFLSTISAAVGKVVIPLPVSRRMTRGFDPKDPVTSSNKGEILNVKDKINAQKPCPIGLVASTDVAKIGNSHQVVAIGFEDFPGNADGTFGVHLYDNNFPEEPMILFMDPTNPTVLKEKKASSGPTGTTEDTWAGFFVGEDYTDKKPEDPCTPGKI